MRYVCAMFCALALAVVALMAVTVTPVGISATLPLVEAASRMYSFPYFDGTRQYLTLNTDYVGVCIDRKAGWGERENSVDIVRHTPGVVMDEDILAGVSAGNSDLTLVAYPVDAIGPAIANFKAARGVYSINLVFEPTLEWTRDVHVSYLEPVSAAHNIYSNALYNLKEPLLPRPFEIEPELLPLTEDPDRVAPGPVVKETRVSALVLTNYFQVTVDHEDHVSRVLETILGHGGALRSQERDQHGQVRLSCTLAPRARALGYHTLDLIHFAEQTGHVAHAWPGFKFFRESYYRRATSAEIADHLARQGPLLTLEEIERRELERRYPDIPPTTPYYYYVRENQAVSLSLEGRQIAVWLQDEATEEERFQTQDNICAIMGLSKAPKQFAEYSIYEATIPLSEHDMHELCDLLLRDPHVNFVSPVMLDKGIEVLLLQPIVFALPSDISRTVVEELANATGLYVDDCFEGDNSVNNIALLRTINKTSGLELLNLCHQLREILPTITPSPDKVRPSYSIWQSSLPNDPEYVNGKQWNLNSIGCPAAWVTTTGDPSISMGVIDTGVDMDHLDLTRISDGIIVHGSSLDDLVGHGTSIAGILGATTNNNLHMAGVTWSGVIRPIKIDNDGFSATDVRIALGIYHALSNGLPIINISAGITDSAIPSVIKAQLDQAYINGSLVVASSGNSGQNELNWPAAYFSAISVGGLDSSDVPDPDNSFNFALDLLAPGIDITTTSNNGGITHTFSGTSAAAPHVAGVAALILSATLDDQGNKTLDGHDVHAILRFSAHDLGAAGDDDLTGYGRLDAAKAIEVALSKRLIIRDIDGKRVLWFDRYGNLMIYGRVRYNVSQPTLDVLAQSSSFVLKKGALPRVVLSRAADPVLGTFWTLNLGGTFAQKVNPSILAYPTDSFVIASGTEGNPNVALIDQNGNMKLTGYVFQAYDPDSLPQSM